MSLYHLASALRANREAGTPIPEVWQTLTNADVVFRRPQLAVVAAAPGVGKSAFVLSLVVKSGEPTVYFSADSGPGTQIPRTVSILTGRETSELRSVINRGYRFEKELQEGASHIWWDFSPGPTLEHIDETIQAWGYLGRYPSICVVDNLVDVDNEGAEGEWKSFENSLLFFKELARERNMCVIVLHHLTGEYEDGVSIPPLSALRGKVSKIPEIVLTLYRQENPLGGEDLGIAIVKNRDGLASAAGNHTVSLAMDLSRMSIEDRNQAGVAS